MGGQAAAARLAGREPAGVLVERDRDLAIVEEAIAEAARGRSAVVAIEGPAGIGKTRLLTEGRRFAQGAGVRVLAARASELEGELAFGVVRQLFEGAFDAGGVDPLGSGAAAGEAPGSPLDAADPTGAKDVSFAILHSLYWFTVTLAADSPLAIAVDDLHWCDAPSLRFLNYLVRRLEGLAIAVLCTVRPRERRARAPLVTEIVGDPLATSVRPKPLSSEATARLVTEALGETADETFSAACHAATGGNPLLLMELMSTLQIEGVRPGSGQVAAVRDLGPRAVSRSVLVRLGRLTEDAQRLARAASVAQGGADLSLVAALAGLEADDAASAARAGVAAEILSNEAEVAFVHPLVGEAVYEDMPALDRSLAHEHAARLLRERGSPAGTVAMHLALAPARGQEWVCDILEQAARESLRAGSPASAIRYLARALSESPPPGRRPRLLLELGSAEAVLYAPAAIEHLTAAFEQDSDLAVRDAAVVPLARALAMYERADEFAALIRRVSAATEPGSDVRLALKALELMGAAYGSGQPVPLARVEHRVAPGAGPGAKMLAAVVSRQWAYAGGSADECAQLALDALEGGDLMAADSGAFLAITAILTLVRADRPEADDHWEDLRRESRLSGSLAAKVGSSLWGGYVCLRRGELDDAEESLKNALEEYRLLGSASRPLVLHGAFLSAVLRERGDLDRARRVLEEVEVPRDTSDTARYWLDALAELLLAEERFDEAYVVATDMERRFAFLANPFDTPALSHQAVALYHLRRHEEGLALAVESLELARRWGAPGGLARALRVLGTLEGEDGLGRLRDAVDAAEGSVARLEHAKAMVALGTALRRSRRPVDAREPLRRGLGARRRARCRGARHPRAARTPGGRCPPADQRAHRPGRAHCLRAPRGRARGRGADQPGDRRGAVRDHEDRRAAPAQRLPQARHTLARRAPRQARPSPRRPVTLGRGSRGHLDVPGPNLRDRLGAMDQLPGGRPDDAVPLIHIELWHEGSMPVGVATGPSGATRDFAGWVGLMSAVEALAGGGGDTLTEDSR